MAAPWTTTASNFASWVKWKCSKGEAALTIVPDGPRASCDLDKNDPFILLPSYIPQVHDIHLTKAEKRIRARDRRSSVLAQEECERITLMGLIRANLPVSVFESEDDNDKEEVKRAPFQEESEIDFEIHAASDDEIEQEEGERRESQGEMEKDEFVIGSDDELYVMGSEKGMESDDEKLVEDEISAKDAANGGRYEGVAAECYPSVASEDVRSEGYAPPNASVTKVGPGTVYSHADVSVTEVASEIDTAATAEQQTSPELNDLEIKKAAGPAPLPTTRKSRHYRLGERRDRNPFHGTTATNSMEMNPRMSFHEQKSLSRPGRHVMQPFILSHGIPRDAPELANQETPKLWQPERKEVLAALHKGMIPQGRVMTQTEIDDEQEELHSMKAQAIQ